MSTQPTKHLEIETYYLFGVGVTVKIDYNLGRISLLNNDGKPKQWVFAERQLEYMEGWRNILKAMEYAISEAEKKLEKHNKAREKALGIKEKDLDRAIAEINKDVNKRI